MTVAYLLKHDKFGSNFVLIKQNLPNSIILPPKNGGFKARSHSVRKANLTRSSGLDQIEHWIRIGSGLDQDWTKLRVFDSHRGQVRFSPCNFETANNN